MFAFLPAAEDLGLAADCEMGTSVIVAALASAEPGSQLQGWLALLEPAQLTEGQVLDVGVALERQRRHNAALEFALLHRLESLPVIVPDSVEPDGDRCSETMGPLQWTAVATGNRLDAYAAPTAQSPGTVSRNAAAAQLLNPGGPLAATGAALAAGQVSEIRAKVIAEHLGEVDPADATAIEAAVLPDADLLSRGRLIRELASLKAALSPKTEQEQHIEARARRCVSKPMALPAGMAFLEVLGPAEDLVLLHTALTAVASGAAKAARAAARGTADTVEGIDAHRFDALINLAAGLLSDDDLPTKHGRRPAIGITVALSTLLGLDDHPADLAGYGPITAAAARRAAADSTGTFQRLITRPDGLVVDAAYTSYRLLQALCDTVIARDRTCTYPDCTRPAADGDLDHETPWPGGETSYANLGDRCKHHHNAKTARLCTPRFDPLTGDTVWTFITGHVVRRPAERYWQPDPGDPAALARPCPECRTRSHGDEPCPAVVRRRPAPLPPRPRLLRAIADALGPMPAGGAATATALFEGDVAVSRATAFGLMPAGGAGTAFPARDTAESISDDDDPPPF